jgi:hypothetical protein
MVGSISSNGVVFKYVERRKYQYIYAGIRQYMTVYIGENGEFRATQVSVSYHRSDQVIPDTTKCNSEEELIKDLYDIQQNKGPEPRLVSINDMPPQYYIEHKNIETYSDNLTEQLNKLHSDTIQYFLHAFIVPIMDKHCLYFSRSWMHCLILIEKNPEYPKDSEEEWINTNNKEVENLIEFACSRLPMVSAEVNEPSEINSQITSDGLRQLGYMISNDIIPKFIEISE